MTARPSLFAHREEPGHRARHGAAQKQQVPLGVHFHDAESQLSEVARPHVPGHALPLDDARRIGTGGDRAGLPVPGIAVRLGTAAEVMAVHHALETATLGHPRDLDADRKSTRLNSSHITISYAVFCLKKKKKKQTPSHYPRTNSNKPYLHQASC